MRRFLCSICLVTLCVFSSAESVSAQQTVQSPTGWSPVIIPRGSYREHIQAMPIEQRPGRPLHVYGNTIRMFDQARRVDAPVRPLQQILFGTTIRLAR